MKITKPGSRNLNNNIELGEAPFKFSLPGKHRPKHISNRDLKVATHLFITGRTYAGLPHLYTKEAKLLFKDILFEKIKKFGWKLPGWTVLNNHHHLIIDTNRVLKDATQAATQAAAQAATQAATPNDDGIATFTSRSISKFINELHGRTSFAIKKLPPAEVINEQQIIYRRKTPLEGRINKRLERILRQWSSALGVAIRSSDLQVAINKEDRGLKSATPEIATFRSRLNKEQREQVEKAIKKKDFGLAKALLITYLPKSFDIPFWYQYIEHIIQSERDYYKHLNYIHHDCVKHGLVKDMWDYPFSSIHEYDKDLILDCFSKYPIVDFTPTE